MPKLFIHPQKEEAFSFLLKEKKISIGRSKENDISVQDLFCSGQHVFIYPSEEGYVVRDNNSKNGTYLNGKKIQSGVKLNPGDEILIGSTRISFEKEKMTNVEVTETPSSSSSINTIVHLKEILKKPDINTTISAEVPSFDLDKIKSEHKAYSILSEVSKELIFHRPLAELLDYIMDLICQHLPMDRGILMLKEGNPPLLVPKIVRINNERLKKRKIQVSKTIINMAIDKHSSVLTFDAQSDPRFKAKESIIRSNIHSAMCVPLWNNKEIIGIVYSDRILLLEQFSEDDLKLLTLLSNLAAVKIENAMLFEKAIEKEKMEKELALAAQIQKDFLPRGSPEVENFEIAGSNTPCHHVGGDYYDYIPIDSERMGVIIADVSGKGVSASLLMASLRAALYSEIHPQYKLEKMASKLNNFVHRSSGLNSFITFFFCEINKKTGQLKYVNAGHNPPFIVNRRGKVHNLECCGFCLGMFPSVTYEVKESVLKPGDLALLFTDGIIESCNRKNEEFSSERLIDLIRENSRLSACELLEKIEDELRSFTSGADRMDDMTLVIVKRTAAA